MKKSPRRPSPIAKFFGALGYGLVLLIACAAGVVANMARQSSLIVAALNPWSYINVNPKDVFHDYDGLTLLVLGTDEDRVMTGWGVDAHGHQHAISKVTRKGARADMILVAKLDFDKNTITGVSVPRDTGCRLPGYSWKKINGYYSVAKRGQGKELMKKAVEDVMPGVKIDRVIAINYDAFQDLVNIVGGVPVVVPKGRNGKGLQYDDNAGDLHIHLSPGPQVLDGKDAMGYVRFRHDTESDFGRQERQKEFLASFKSSIFHHPFQLPAIAEQTKEVMDNALTDQEIIALVAFARKVPQGSIKLGMLPTVERRGTTMLRVDADKREDVMRQYGLLDASATPSTPAEAQR